MNNTPMSFREILYMFNEAFDSPQKIQKKYSHDNVDFYEIYIGKYSYRIVIENLVENKLKCCEIIFERLVNKEWKIDIATNDLHTSEIMGLFSTIYDIIKTKKIQQYNYIVCRTDNFKKHRLYFKLFREAFPNHTIGISDNEVIKAVTAFKDNLIEDQPSLLKKFKYKK